MKRVKRLVALVLCCVLFFSNIPHANATIELSAPINLYVYSVEGEKYVGDFIVYDGVLGVEVNTLKKMHKDIKFVDVPENSDDHICIQRGDKKVTYRVEEVLDMDYSVYFPFEKTVFDLDLWIDMPVEGTLVIKNPPVFDDLLQTVYDIVMVKKYNMPHWWNNESNIKEYEAAYLADAVGGLKFGYLTGAEQREQYETACFSIMHPMNDDELEFAMQTIDMVKLTKDIESIYDPLKKATDKIDKVGLKEFVKKYGVEPEEMKLDFFDLLQTESLLKMYAYTCGVKGEETDYISGLTYVLNTQKNDDKQLFEGGHSAIAMKEGEYSVWEALVHKIALNGATWALDTVVDYGLPIKPFLKVAEIVGDKAFGTKKVVDGTIMAFRYLTIQDMCAKAILNLRRDYLKKAKFDDHSAVKGILLRHMVEVSKVYMKAGVLAWDARVIDDNTRESAEEQLNAMLEDLKTMEQYSDEEIGYTLNYATVTKQIEKCADKYLEDFENYELPVEAADGENIVVEVSWDCDYNGQYRFVDTWVYGYADSGEMVERAETEGVYLAGEEAIAMQEVYEDHTKLTFLGVNGEYRVEIGNFDDYMTKNWHINEYDLKVTVYVPGQEPMVITDDPENYYMRGMDSYWYYCFGVVDGEITSLIWNP